MKKSMLWRWQKSENTKAYIQRKKANESAQVCKID
jgi:hypothetical protein